MNSIYWWLKFDRVCNVHIWRKRLLEPIFLCVLLCDFQPKIDASYRVWVDMLTPRTVIYVVDICLSLDVVKIFFLTYDCCVYDWFKIKIKFKHINVCFLCVIDTFSLLFACIMKNRQNVKWICWQLFILWEDLVFFVHLINKFWCCVMLWQIMSFYVTWI